MIASVHNPRVKQAIRLRDHRQRRKEQLILIDGARELARAITAGVALREVFVCPELCRSEEARRLLELLPGSGRLGHLGYNFPPARVPRRLDVTEAVFAKLAFGQRAEGVVGVAAAPRRRLEDLVLPANPLVAVLEGVEKPGNVGAVLRSADGAGVSALVVTDPRTDLFNPNVIRASLGTIFSLPVAAAAAGDVLAWLRGHRLQILAARVEGVRFLHGNRLSAADGHRLRQRGPGADFALERRRRPRHSPADARRGRQLECLRRRRRLVL